MLFRQIPSVKNLKFASTCEIAIDLNDILKLKQQKVTYLPSETFDTFRRTYGRQALLWYNPLTFLSVFDFPFHSAEEDEYKQLGLLLMVYSNFDSLSNAANQKTGSD